MCESPLWPEGKLVLLEQNTAPVISLTAFAFGLE